MVNNPKEIDASQLEEARCRYARDLLTLRKQQRVSLETVYVETRIPKSVLIDYETSGLYNHESFHEVYLRSLTKAYALAVGLDVDRVLSALERALDGSYNGGLMSPHEPEEEGAAGPENESSQQDSASKSEPKSGASPPKQDGSTEGT